jgi:hypothetical protein
MSFFGQKKPKVQLSDFCGNFYNNFYLHPLNELAGAAGIYANVVKKMAVEADDAFSGVSDEQFTQAIQPLQFEIFALAWLHKNGEGLAVAQSIFTKKYLYENDREDIWTGMESYNSAIAHASKVGLSGAGQARLLRKRADAANKWIEIANKEGRPIDEADGRPVNRFFSEVAWRKRNTIYFLILVLCHKLELGYGPSYLGPNIDAQTCLGAAIRGLYDGVAEALNEVTIS